MKLMMHTEDLLEQSKKAVGIPFKSALCIKIASSQFDGTLRANAKWRR